GLCEKVNTTQDVLLRINANFDIHDAQTTFSGGSKKFGIDEEQLDVALPQILALDKMNPQIAARMVRALMDWKRLEPTRQTLMKAELQTIADSQGLSGDVQEIVNKRLEV
ncbi:MAG: aminopeptidase N C-terminal domain-containing protein, partial [Ghiorsea sp.]|nr:aminopeptidase N C-terminal domain-containing protein [Ghiorsea sp.]